MKKSILLKSFIAVAVFLAATVCVVTADSSEEMCFRNKARDTVEKKTGCHKIAGKHDVYPRYECEDSSGKLNPIDPKKWEVTECPKKTKEERAEVPKEGEFEKRCTLKDLGLR
ncbi:MAG: hypothetical protein GY795_49760 [Desulfobacterales bacterium]|nr:hypothetical protein [Desulfobacterales bacterium]